MAEKEATGKLEKQDLALELGWQYLEEDKAEKKADTTLSHHSIDALQALREDFVDTDWGQVYYDTGEDADDEISTDDDYEEIHPLNVRKAKTSNENDQAHPEQTTQTTAHTHSRVECTDNFAQAQKNSAEAGHTAPIALKHNLPRAPTPYPEPLSVQQVSDLLHPSPPLRRRKGSMALGKKISDSATAHSMMSETEETQEALYSNDQDRAAVNNKNSDAYLTPTHRGKMSKAHDNQDPSSGEDQGNAAEIGQSSETSTNSKNHVVKHKTSGFPKADAVLGYGEEDKITPKKTMTNLITSPKASHEKKSFRKLFHRKESTESTTPPSSSAKTAARMTISAPTLVDASPNAKVLLNSAHLLVDASPDGKNVVNYSRPIAPHSSSDVSNGSPVVRSRSEAVFDRSIPFSGPYTSPEGLTDKSGNIPVDLNTSLIYDHSNASAVRGHQAADERGDIPETSATEKNPDASDSDSFNPSDYSGDENSVQQAVAMPIVFSGKAKLVDVRPPRGTNTAASGNRSGVGLAIAPGTAQITDHDAEALGAQDADRYCRNAMTSQTRPTTITTDDPFIDPAYQKLLAKPANEIAAKEMARIKAAREAENMGGGLMDRMNALLAKSNAKPAVKSTGDATTGPRTTTSESLLSKMRALAKKPKKGKEQEDSEEEVVRKVKAEKERGLREEKEINAIIKAKLATKDAANGGVRGAGIPRIDYGPPNPRTALGGSGPTDEERAHARTLADRRAAGLATGHIPNHKDNTTARGQFEGY